MRRIVFAFAAVLASLASYSTEQLPANVNPLPKVQESFAAAWAGLPSEPAVLADLPPLELVRSGLFTHSEGITEVASLDGQHVAGTTDGDLYVRSRRDGNRRVIARADADGHWDIDGAIWSPDGSLLAATKVEDSRVPRMTLSGAQFGPSGVARVPYSRVGQAIPRLRVLVINIRTGAIAELHLGRKNPYFHIIGWRGDGKELRLLRADRLKQRLELLTADAGTGKVRRLLTESKPLSLVGLNMLHGYSRQMREQNIVSFLPDNSFVWTSERTGYRHLYHHDAKGRRLRSLTEGRIDGWVDRIVGTDFARQLLFVRTYESRDAYGQQLLSIAIDTRKIIRLARNQQIPQVKFSPDKRRIWMVLTGLPDMYRIDEIASDGQGRRTVWKADWDMPKSRGFGVESVMVAAADNKTLLRAVVFTPIGLRRDLSYPVIHDIYAAPHSISVPLSARNPTFWRSFELAQRGYVVVSVTGRGTPGRGRDFQEYSFGRFGQVEIADQVAALRNLAKDRPYMDLDRVGVWGHSWGGYFGLRALLEAPELYKAGAFSAGAFELGSMRVPAEPYVGCLPATCPEVYREGSNFALLQRLAAPLLLLHGTADNDVPIEESQELTRALRKAGKVHELVVIPGGTHSLIGTEEHKAKFYAQHLIGECDALVCPRN